MNLGRYELMGRLASGGMAEVYLAKAAGPMGFEKRLVVKRILPHLAEDASFIEMFFAEARLVAKLDHPNIVQIFDFGESGGEYYLAMEYIDGLNLRILSKRTRVAGERLPVSLCAKIVSFACEGLAYAHEFVEPETGMPLRLVHRDISPDNILVSTNGAVKLADFGIAKAANQMHRTQTGVVKGKVAYMPPEQLRGKTLDARTDLFALGVVLYELLSGRKPFEAENETGMVLAILHEEPVPITEHRADVPGSVQRIIGRALAKEPNDRYASCRELQMDLERYLRTCDEPVGAIDIARWVARVSSPGVMEPRPTPAVAPAPLATTAASPSRERAQARAEAAPTEVTPPTGSGPSQLGDATRTDPLQQTPRSSSLGRWPKVAALGTAALVLALAGHRLLGGTQPKQAPVPAAQQLPPVVKATGSEQAAQSGSGYQPTTQDPVPPPSSSDTEKPQQVSSPNGALEAVTTPPLPVEPSNTAPTPPPSPVAVVPASLRVESTLPGLVLVNRKPVGRTPADVKGLAPGQVTVEVFDSQQGFSKRQTVALKPGDTRVVRLEIGKGRLSFLVNPYATVLLDGKEVGVTPFSPLEVHEGRHSVTLINKQLGKQVSGECVVKAGETFVYKANLLR
jgi:serine/threonine-protein kinase